MMTDKARDAYDRWKTADQAARAREEELKRAWNLFFEHKKNPPADELIREVALLRKQAGELLKDVVRLTGSVGSGPLRS